MTRLGKAIRIARLQNPLTGRIFTAAVDHAPSYGVLKGLEDIRSLVDQVAGGSPDAMVMSKGVAECCFHPYAGHIALILKCSTLSPFHPEHDVWVSPVEDALRLGADAIAMALTVGSAQQPALLSNLAALVREAERVGLPVIVHAYPNGELVPPAEHYSVDRVGYAARLAMELGVDIVKTFYTGSAETFARVVELVAPVPVVAAGGPRLETDADVFQMAYDVVQAGAAGITFGRNIWQSDDPQRIVTILKQVVHQEVTPAVALEMWTQEAGVY
ncbi:MAG: 2-amino-3,7-dideoxy-D-threo-hept-6-ulosonate synthase [Ardenticatenaceae bacterium]|nr:2-amino-3,7-dideoxy-D-threo-hept-6-ulosonate synthase [Ardenticatenaceae bacterium]